MSEIIPIKPRMSEDGCDYIIDDVQCPKAGTKINAVNCKTCKHCSIFLGDKVKCSYNHDKEMEEKPFIHPVYIL